MPGLLKDALLLLSMPDAAQLRFLDFTGAVWHMSGERDGARAPSPAALMDCPRDIRLCR